MVKFGYVVIYVSFLSDALFFFEEALIGSSNFHGGYISGSASEQLLGARAKTFGTKSSLHALSLRYSNRDLHTSSELS